MGAAVLLTMGLSTLASAQDEPTTTSTTSTTTTTVPVVYEWRSAVLAEIPAVSHSMVLVDGRPRLVASLYDTITYGECDADCDLAESWRLVDLGQRGSGVHLETDESGAMHVAYASGDELFYGSCPAGCADPASWDFLSLGEFNDLPVGLGQAYSLGVDAGGRPRLAYSHYWPALLRYSVCETACTESTDSWVTADITPADLLTSGKAEGMLPLLATARGGEERIVAHVQYPAGVIGTQPYYLECDAGCADQGALQEDPWRSGRLSPPTYVTGIELDGTDPRLLAQWGYEDTEPSGRRVWYGQCDGGCTETAPWTWTEMPVGGDGDGDGESDANAIRASLALTPDGRPRVAFIATEGYSSSTTLFIRTVDRGHQSLELASCDEGCGDTGNWTREPVTSAQGDVTLSPSVATGAGHPAVAYTRFLQSGSDWSYTYEFASLYPRPPDPPPQEPPPEEPPPEDPPPDPPPQEQPPEEPPPDPPPPPPPPNNPPPAAPPPQSGPPAPQPVPAPAPQPAPAPAPQPAPAPAPAPAQQPAATVQAQPAPQPAPQVSAQSAPQPTPQATTQPSAQAAPQPASAPQAAPQPTPSASFQPSAGAAPSPAAQGGVQGVPGFAPDSAEEPGAAIELAATAVRRDDPDPLWSRLAAGSVAVTLMGLAAGWAVLAEKRREEEAGNALATIRERWNP